MHFLASIPCRDGGLNLRFSGSRVFFPPGGTPPAHYELVKGRDDYDKVVWQVRISGGPPERIELTWFNKAKANIIHKRYWIQNDWLVRGAVLAGIGVLLAKVGAAIFGGH